jgi:hypothetical protein
MNKKRRRRGGGGGGGGGEVDHSRLNRRLIKHDLAQVNAEAVEAHTQHIHTRATAQRTENDLAQVDAEAVEGCLAAGGAFQ